MAFTTPFGRDFPCLRLPSNPSAPARTAGRSVRTGGFTTPVLSPAPKYPSQKAAETASNPPGPLWLPSFVPARPHTGSQGRTRGINVLCRQLLLRSLTFCGDFCSIQLVLVMQLDRFADGADVVAQIAVLFEAILHNDGCWFRSDETFHHQSVHIPFDGSFASVDGAANGFVAGPALVPYACPRISTWVSNYLYWQNSEE